MAGNRTSPPAPQRSRWWEGLIAGVSLLAVLYMMCLDFSANGFNVHWQTWASAFVIWLLVVLALMFGGRGPRHR